MKTVTERTSTGVRFIIDVDEEEIKQAYERTLEWAQQNGYSSTACGSWCVSLSVNFVESMLNIKDKIFGPIGG